MSNTGSLYCKVFVDTDIAQEQLIAFLRTSICGISEIRIHTVANDDLDIYVDKNDDFDETKRSMGNDGFLFYRYALDIEPTKSTTQERFMGCVGILLEALWREGYKAAAACDFERKLPKSGGYQPESAGIRAQHVQ
jgi:hypothetical protein